MISTTYMRQYDQHLQEKRREFRDAQYDGEMLINLVGWLRARVSVLFNMSIPRPSPQLPGLSFTPCAEPTGIASAPCRPV